MLFVDKSELEGSTHFFVEVNFNIFVLDWYNKILFSKKMCDKIKDCNICSFTNARIKIDFLLGLVFIRQPNKLVKV